MKIVFLGTPKFGADVLNILLKSKHETVGVVCQPDRAGNRKKIENSPVKNLALENGVKVFQFEKISAQDISGLETLRADVFITAAYGQFLSGKVLALPRYGVFNVHGSLLPKYRGAAPVQFALLNGEKITGVSIMKTELAMDSGDIAAQRTVSIEENDNSATLLDKLADAGGIELLNVLDKIESGNLVLRKQDEAEATFCTKITADMPILDWNNSNVNIFNKIRAFNPNPVACTSLNGVNVKIFESRPVELNLDGQNGEVVECSKNVLRVKCGKGGLEILSLQIAGGKVIGFKDFINGRKIKTGDVFGK